MSVFSPLDRLGPDIAAIARRRHHPAPPYSMYFSRG